MEKIKKIRIKTKGKGFSKEKQKRGKKDKDILDHRVPGGRSMDHEGIIFLSEKLKAFLFLNLGQKCQFSSTGILWQC